MSRDSDDPRDLLAYLLKHAHLRLTGLVDAGLAPYDIDGKDFGVLRVVATGEPKSQAAVAQILAIDRTTMVALVDALERKGVVTRRPDPADRRRNVVELTEQGRTTYDKAAEAYAAAEQELLAPLEEARASDLARLLRELVSAERSA
ncbi:MarR family transcriptional regulator [Marmoricola endophyticus]|uniref:MarR family transcriptional regulator n=1 Tax=Marmoricola endophyticus TaxID=2040280 RepID=A0A917BPI1_9ACTN|nr:MarR family winged helix-turn-helix transcriptional regulator [Marmoricola endophyticus]GGF51246.1 MarR family transcriptional regulator [Marmoricola endophyticus]